MGLRFVKNDKNFSQGILLHPVYHTFSELRGVYNVLAFGIIEDRNFSKLYIADSAGIIDDRNFEKKPKQFMYRFFSRY